MKSIVIARIKSELKELVQNIRKSKPEFRQAQSICSKAYSEPNRIAICKAEKTLVQAQREFRHQHIAYCLVRGKSLEQIEPSSSKRCADNCFCCNKPNMKDVNQLLEQYKKELADEETLHPSRRESV